MGVGGSFRGVSIAGVGTGVGENAFGILINGVGMGVGGDAQGLMINGTGMGVGGDVTGVMLNGFGMGAGGTIRFLSLAGGGIGATRLEGIAIAGGVLGAREMQGVMIAGFWNRVRREDHGWFGRRRTVGGPARLEGVGISAFNQVLGHQQGLTIGLLNYAWSLNGLQVGLINIVRDNPPGRRVLPVLNWGR